MLPLRLQYRQSLLAALDGMSAAGLRVITFAYRDLPETKRLALNASQLESGSCGIVLAAGWPELTIVGLLALQSSRSWALLRLRIEFAAAFREVRALASLVFDSFRADDHVLFSDCRAATRRHHRQDGDR